MAVISITITSSEEEIISGIPKKISLSTNIPASIFYTLDGTTPTLFSSIYTDTIFLPTDKLSITLSVFATNGVDNSAIITETFTTNIVSGTNARLAHSATTAQPGESLDGLYPYGTNAPQPGATYLSTAEAGITVNDPSLPSTPTGYDGSGNPTGFTNKAYDLTNYSIEYSTSNSIGETGPGIGTLPANVKIAAEPAPPNESFTNSNMFDPRAFVIFQDANTENVNDPPHINRISFSLENPERARDGNHYYTAGLDAPPVSGSFLRSHYNPRTNQITYYYLDTWTNKWIISTAPYVNTNPQAGNLAGVVLSSKPGSKYVFEWLPFTRRVLF